jgi:hypothetical protein
MKPYKRLAKALRRGKVPKEKREKPSAFVDLVIPSAGEARFRTGFGYTLGLVKAALRRPFRSIPLTLSTAFVFTVLKMSLIYMVGLALWGTSTPTAMEQRYINAGMWEIFSWAMAPIVLTPWLAASVIAANGLPVRWRLVKEPLAVKGRWLQLLVVGLAALVLVGAAGAALRPAVAAWGVGPTIAVAVVLYGLFQPTLMATVAGVWQDSLPAHQAMWHAIRGWKTLWRPLLGSALCLFLVLLGLLALIVVGIALPLSAVGMPPSLMVVVGMLLLPVWLMLWAMWNQVRGGLALAYYDWGYQPSPPPTL